VVASAVPPVRGGPGRFSPDCHPPAGLPHRHGVWLHVDGGVLGGGAGAEAKRAPASGWREIGPGPIRFTLKPPEGLLGNHQEPSSGLPVCSPIRPAARPPFRGPPGLPLPLEGESGAPAMEANSGCRAAAAPRFSQAHGLGLRQLCSLRHRPADRSRRIAPAPAAAQGALETALSPGALSLLSRASPPAGPSGPAWLGRQCPALSWSGPVPRRSDCGAKLDASRAAVSRPHPPQGRAGHIPPHWRGWTLEMLVAPW